VGDDPVSRVPRIPEPQPRLVAIAAITAGIGLVVLGALLWFPPAGLVAAGLALLGSVTFDPSKAGSLRWPR
jgi:hypothetical protein